MKLRHLAMAVGGLIVLSACTRGSGFDRAYFWEANGPFGDCKAKHAEVLKGVNWGEAEVVDIVVRQGTYSPASFDLERGKPYLLRVHNDDDRLRTITSNEFFTNAAVGAIIVDGKPTKPDVCISRVKLTPNKSTFVQVLPFREGRYRWADNLGPIGFIWFGQNDFGDIVVR